jgi:hypothetical protein
MPTPEPNEAPTVENVSTSELREATYALETFGELGLDPLESLSLLDSGLSPSRLRELVTHGCDVRTALSILL